MRVTDITGHIRPDMTYDVDPMEVAERRRMVPEMEFENPIVNLRVRPDYDQFKDSDHEHNGALHQVRALRNGAECAPVTVERRFIKTHSGLTQKNMTIDIGLVSTPVPYKRALTVLDQYPTLVEEVTAEVAEDEPKAKTKKRR